MSRTLKGLSKLRVIELKRHWNEPHLPDRDRRVETKYVVVSNISSLNAIQVLKWWFKDLDRNWTATFNEHVRFEHWNYETSTYSFVLVREMIYTATIL